MSPKSSTASQCAEAAGLAGWLYNMNIPAFRATESSISRTLVTSAWASEKTRWFLFLRTTSRAWDRGVRLATSEFPRRGREKQVRCVPVAAFRRKAQARSSTQTSIEAPTPFNTLE